MLTKYLTKKTKTFSRNIRNFCTLYYSLENGEGVKNLTYRERNKFKNVANTYGFQIKSKSQPTDNYELKFYVWKVGTYIEKKNTKLQRTLDRK